MVVAWLDRIRRHMVNPESHHRRIAGSFLLVSFFALVGKLAGAAKEMTIAWRYGISETVDAYIFVFTLTTWFPTIWFSALTVVLVPLAARLRINDPSEIPRFRSELLGFTLIFGILLCILMYWILPYILNAGWTRLSVPTLDLASKFARVLAPLVLLGFIISLFSAWMLAGGHHRNTLLEAIPALVLLGVLLLPSSWVSEPLLWGTLAGSAFQLAALSVPLKQRGELQAPHFSFHSPAWKGFWDAIGVLAISQTLMSFTGIIDQFTAANLGAGAISTLSYAHRVVALLLTLGAMAIGRAILPVFSDMFARGVGDLRRTAFQWGAWMFLLGFGASLVTWLLSPWVVAILFERGAFNATDTNSVSEVLRWGLVQVPFYFAGLVVVQLLASQQRYGVIAFLAITNLFVKMLCNFMLAEWMGVPGIALATGLMYVWSTICLYIAALRVIRP
ncbi:lipid II flippase MurJ [uncultured Nitrosomonas sp.]|uniref:murein biosynthesis integral membrane protein MurJ n=1 Tax=uncultured Nitrosomonas sp. TaxID=156424 RepID=UPI0025E4B533|nr:lipid II flippase MurJ [uncultured Nitrosomonas sp.]